jgi:hypothetical protein
MQLNDAMKETDAMASRSGIKLLEAEAEIERLKMDLKDLKT